MFRKLTNKTYDLEASIKSHQQLQLLLKLYNDVAGYQLFLPLVIVLPLGEILTYFAVVKLHDSVTLSELILYATGAVFSTWWVINVVGAAAKLYMDSCECAQSCKARTAAGNSKRRSWIIKKLRSLPTLKFKVGNTYVHSGYPNLKIIKK